MTLNFLFAQNLSIFEQLKLEEGLLKTNDENWCIVNLGSPTSVVLGAFNDEKLHLQLDLIKKDKIPLIKRFSGGGSVIVDENTIFITFIFSKKTLNFSYPEEIFKWTENFYKKFFPSSFSLQENDYILENKKCAGNAQYLKKTRWLHHSSFLWEFDNKKMDYLLLPKKAPKYRDNRSHENFLCTIKDLFVSKIHFASLIKSGLNELFILKETSLQDGFSYCLKEHLKTTKFFQY
jgi:lipoate---protein ligase